MGCSRAEFSHTHPPLPLKSQSYLEAALGKTRVGEVTVCVWMAELTEFAEEI